MMKVLETLCFSLLSIGALFALTKLLGPRQMSQLTLFDYITGITIGSVAAEIATHPGEESWLGLLVIAVFAGVTLLMNLLNEKSLPLRRFFLGEPLILFSNGKLYYQNLKKAKIDLTEFLTQCRARGYFHLSKLYMVILEVNGKLSFLPMEADRPLTPADMEMAPAQQRAPAPVILDGVVQTQTLKAIGLDDAWLKKQWMSQGFHSTEEILLAMVDADNRLSLYEKDVRPPAREPFA